MPKSDPKLGLPFMVGLFSWLIPGAGYMLIGQRLRGITVGLTIILLFNMGILIGGIRVMDPPGWDDSGKMIQVAGGYAIVSQPLAQLADKPWFVGQVLCGPITLIASEISVHEAQRMEGPVFALEQVVPTSHSRSWEIGALYTAVAGMLNLLVLIDATFRASGDSEDEQKPEPNSAEYSAKIEQTTAVPTSTVEAAQ